MLWKLIQRDHLLVLQLPFDALQIKSCPVSVNSILCIADQSTLPDFSAHKYGFPDTQIRKGRDSKYLKLILNFPLSFVIVCLASCDKRWFIFGPQPIKSNSCSTGVPTFSSLTKSHKSKNSCTLNLHNLKRKVSTNRVSSSKHRLKGLSVTNSVTQHDTAQLSG